MPDRLEIHSATIDLDIEGEAVCVGGYAVFDNVACIVRHASLQFRWCEQWISNHSYEYPDTDEDDDLS